MHRIAAITTSVIGEIMADLAERASVRVRDGAPFEVFLSADEAFLSSSLKEVLPVTRVDGRAIGSGKPGPVTAKLLTALRERIARETGSRIASIHRSERTEDALKMLAAFGRCLPAGRGAWALSLDRVTNSDGGPYGQWSLVHIASDGSTTAVTPSIPSSDTRSERWDPRDRVDSKGNFDFTVGILLHLAPPVVFDYDGDGDAEIVLQVGSQISEGGTWENGRVWTARGGTVHLYGPASRPPPQKPETPQTASATPGGARPALASGAHEPRVQRSTQDTCIAQIVPGLASPVDGLQGRSATRSCRALAAARERLSGAGSRAMIGKGLYA